MSTLSELEQKVLKEAYPQLSFTDDLDIERYFELRNSGRMQDAISLYNRTIRRKYPDDDMRVKLLSLYRMKDPQFQEILTDNLVNLANKTISQLKRIIVYITNKIMMLDFNDVFSVIHTCESLVSAISSDRFASIRETQKYTNFAKILNFRMNEMADSAKLIKLYVTDNLSSVNAFRQAQAEKKRNALSNEKTGNKAKVFDFSKIIFTKEQKNAIVLNSSITRVEDKVLSYIIKYWGYALNVPFENMILMYSRKYKTEHYNIFMTIKTARVRNWRDDELIHAVLSTVVSGYYYSISGDMYLQRNWARIKPSLIASSEQKSTHLLPEPKTKKIDVPKNTKSTATEANNQKQSKKTPKTKTIQQKTKTSKSQKTTTQSKKSSPKLFVAETTAEKKHSKTTKSRVKKPKANVFIPQKTGFIDIKKTRSIEQLLKRATGKTYVLYKDVFFKSVRQSIRYVLQHCPQHKHSMFNTEQNTAENIIYVFLERNYNNPYQNWADSNAKERVLELGYKIEAIEPIIEHWVKNELK